MDKPIKISIIVNGFEQTFFFTKEFLGDDYIDKISKTSYNVTKSLLEQMA